MADGKFIGLLGGLSWVSFMDYYETLNRMAVDRFGPDNSFNCLIRSVEFSEIAKNSRIDDLETIGKIFREAVLLLERAGVDGIAMCSNTPHMYAADLRRELKIPLIHIGEATAARVAMAGVRRVLLLGTKFTMQQPFYREALANQGIEMIVPGEEEMKWVHRSIIDEMVRNEFRPQTRDGYRGLIERFSDEGAEGVIYGCTEIPALMKEVEFAIPTFDTLRIHCEAIAEFAFA